MRSGLRGLSRASRVQGPVGPHRVRTRRHCFVEAVGDGVEVRVEAEAGPSMRWTTFTLAPVATAGCRQCPETVWRQRLQTHPHDRGVEDVVAQVGVPSCFPVLVVNSSASGGRLATKARSAGMRKRGIGTDPFSVVLRGIRLQPAGDLHHVGTDVDAPPLEIQVTDAQRGHLPDPAVHVGEEVDQCVVLGCALLRQPPDLLVGEEALLPDWLTRQRDSLRDVPRESSVAYGESQRLGQHKK